MEYIKVNFHITAGEPYQQDLLIDALGLAGFDTFEETSTGFDAFMPAGDDTETLLKTTLAAFDEPLKYTYEVVAVPSENWNIAWEKNFPPLTVKDLCHVRATFHTPQSQYPYEIVIDPKMAFGTGHHETTTMMMEYILENDFIGKKVLDMGCGTGILAILAALRGADPLVAIDYDPLCYDSTLENTALNNIINVEAICGGKEAVPADTYDVILANINRNILLDQIPVYAGVLAETGSIYFSGFYETPDLEMITLKCSEYGIEYESHKTKGQWTAAKFTRQALKI